MVILFDLDGTLVNTAGDLLAAINQLCLEINKPTVDPSIFINSVSFGITKIFQAINIDPNTTNKEHLQKLIDRFKQLYKKTNYQCSRLFPGGLDVINRLKQSQFKIGVVTNKPKEFALPILEKVNLLQTLDCLVTPDLVENPKPHPEPVLLAIDKLQANPEQCVFIGDAEQDIIAGNQAGVTTVAALFGYVADRNLARKTWNADYWVDDFRQIWPLIKTIHGSGSRESIE